MGHRRADGVDNRGLREGFRIASSNLSD